MKTYFEQSPASIGNYKGPNTKPHEIYDPLVSLYEGSETSNAIALFILKNKINMEVVRIIDVWGGGKNNIENIVFKLADNFTALYLDFFLYDFNYGFVKKYEGLKCNTSNAIFKIEKEDIYGITFKQFIGDDFSAMYICDKKIDFNNNEFNEIKYIVTHNHDYIYIYKIY